MDVCLINLTDIDTYGKTLYFSKSKLGYSMKQLVAKKFHDGGVVKHTN